MALLSVGSTSGEAPLELDFDASGSSDPDGSLASVSWDFGDGSPTTTGAAVSHVYLDAGIHTVVLTVEDGDGNIDTDQADITVTPEGLPQFDGGTSVGTVTASEVTEVSGLVASRKNPG